MTGTGCTKQKRKQKQKTIRRAKAAELSKLVLICVLRVKWGLQEH